MRRLRETDGSPVHRRTARYHVTKCTLVPVALHTALAAEMITELSKLIAKTRQSEDLDDALAGAGAMLDAAELGFENVIRELDGALEQLDRDNPSFGAQSATFPEGFGTVIEPDGEQQRAVMAPLKVRLEPFKSQPTIAPILAKLDAADATLAAAVTAATAAEKEYDTAFAEEIAARTAIRQQMESAYGRLRDYYKARPAMAELFFSKEGSRRSAKKAEPAATPKAASTTPAPSAPAVPT